ncbi:uncharacterized oxidoreductase YjmC-like isoform X1 [Daphnia carinata]|uniref:uncharacterized oxidoreductase YjmC-like isoform X1 n=2 Tax=Daphnia carinata TaxID=120202 RepID=UPI0025811C83|nr:uncharacterized oxidoreductase YjmC-like isoform X1 [Daphnia carinata]
MAHVHKLVLKRQTVPISTIQRIIKNNVNQRREVSTSQGLWAAKTHDENTSSPVPVAEVKRYATDCMVSVGVKEDHASALADVLVAADYRGHYSHGLNRLEMYVQDIKSKICDGNAVPTILKDKYSTALVNGQNSLGPVVGNFCMNLAIEKAKKHGVGWVVANNSNHYGIAGWYSILAANQGLLGLSFTSTSPLVAPTRAKTAALGTNPITLAAPALNGDQFVLDMATCTVAVGKIELQRRKGLPIPEGWAIDTDGKITTSADVAMKGCLMPLGGAEETSGYKGYGLATLVEIFCGISAGATYGPNIRRWMDTKRKADLGQCFIAVDPECFASGFQTRMSDLMSHLRHMEPADPTKPILVAGDPERAHIALVDAEGGIRYHVNQINASAALAGKLKVKPMKHIS